MCAIMQPFGRPGTATDQTSIERLNGHLKGTRYEQADRVARQIETGSTAVLITNPDGSDLHPRPIGQMRPISPRSKANYEGLAAVLATQRDCYGATTASDAVTIRVNGSLASPSASPSIAG